MTSSPRVGELLLTAMAVCFAVGCGDGTISPAQSANPPAPTEASVEPSCYGTPADCALFSNEGCALALGCSVQSACNGEATACASLAEVGCEAQHGCSWNSTLAECTGSATDCSDLADDCYRQDGCYDKPVCGGSATPCNVLSESSCPSQLGCSWGIASAEEAGLDDAAPSASDDGAGDSDGGDAGIADASEGGSCPVPAALGTDVCRQCLGSACCFQVESCNVSTAADAESGCEQLVSCVQQYAGIFPIQESVSVCEPANASDAAAAGGPLVQCMTQSCAEACSP